MGVRNREVPDQNASGGGSGTRNGQICQFFRVGDSDWLTSANMTARMAIPRSSPACVAGVKWLMWSAIAYWVLCYEFSLFGRAFRNSERITLICEIRPDTRQP